MASAAEDRAESDNAEQQQKKTSGPHKPSALWYTGRQAQTTICSQPQAWAAAKHERIFNLCPRFSQKQIIGMRSDYTLYFTLPASTPIEWGRGDELIVYEHPDDRIVLDKILKEIHDEDDGE